MEALWGDEVEATKLTVEICFFVDKDKVMWRWTVVLPGVSYAQSGPQRKATPYNEHYMLDGMICESLRLQNIWSLRASVVSRANVSVAVPIDVLFRYIPMLSVQSASNNNRFLNLGNTWLVQWTRCVAKCGEKCNCPLSQSSLCYIATFYAR